MVKINPDITRAMQIKAINNFFWIFHTPFKKR